MSLSIIRTVVLAIKKMDLIGYAEAVYRSLNADYRIFCAQIGLDDITTIPLSVLKGDNMTWPSQRMPWFAGPTLIDFLETTEVDDRGLQAGTLRLPAQWVNLPNQSFPIQV